MYFILNPIIHIEFMCCLLTHQKMADEIDLYQLFMGWTFDIWKALNRLVSMQYTHMISVSLVWMKRIANFLSIEICYHSRFKYKRRYKISIDIRRSWRTFVNSKLIPYELKYSERFGFIRIFNLVILYIIEFWL